ncbi:hypothetical protein ACIQV3_40150 [Streptomyces sp. NPDC099050]|uniref:hypothetical protein n=1 Tax=Streptomyces sp. NPDC099050 TaxID=3366100 RepID=UPI0037FDC1AA
MLLTRLDILAGKLLDATHPGRPLVERAARVDWPGVSRARRATRWCRGREPVSVADAGAADA